MNFFERRRLRKSLHHLFHESRHARHMREDVCAPDKISRILECERNLRDAWSREDLSQVEKYADQLTAAVRDVYPPHRFPRLRENIEILVVAIAVAMAFRTFFVQPFRIPTGSMQPTLNGITYVAQQGKGVMDHFPLSLVPLALFGERYVEVRAQASGTVEFLKQTEDSFVFRIAGIPHIIHQDMPRTFEPMRTVVRKGDVLASGKRRLGDHIFVNRMKYNFLAPERGDVFVFSTRDIKHPDIRPDNYYIKRMAGMPGETISIDPPYLVANGNIVTNPPVFDRQAHDTENGYHGYTLFGDVQNRAQLRKPSDELVLAPDEYLPLGDNTRNSLDGRVFGGVRKRSIIGPAFMVYWPFTSRWGLIE